MLWLGPQLVMALQSMHSKNIMHRDVKMSNVFISDEGYLVVRIPAYPTYVVRTYRSQVRYRTERFPVWLSRGDVHAVGGFRIKPGTVR